MPDSNSKVAVICSPANVPIDRVAISSGVIGLPSVKTEAVRLVHLPA